MCSKCGPFGNITIIPWLNSCRSGMVVLDRFLAWSFRSIRPRSCRSPAALSRTRWTLNAWFLDFRCSLQTSLYWHSLLAVQHHHWLIVISVHHIPAIYTKPFPSFWGRDVDDLHKIFTLSTVLSLMSPPLIFFTFLDEIKWNVHSFIL